ncbi:hypothetical protein TorRG33x02_230640, partial [Trema orientale]
KVGCEQGVALDCLSFDGWNDGTVAGANYCRQIQNWMFVVMKLAMARMDGDNANQIGFNESHRKYAFANEELRCSGVLVQRSLARQNVDDGGW